MERIVWTWKITNLNILRMVIESTKVINIVDRKIAG